MKNILLLFGLIFFSNKINAQSGSIYNFFFKVDPELTEYKKVEVHSRNVLFGTSESEIMPQQLIDSIKKKTEDILTVKLGMPVKCCYHKNKKGEDVGSVDVFGIIEGMPANTFNKSREECPASTRFVSLDVQINASGGISITIGNKKTKIKPKLQITAKVYDENKVEIMKKNIVLKDFEKLRSITKFYGTVEVTKAETLTPYDIYAMYLLGLDELIRELN